MRPTLRMVTSSSRNTRSNWPNFWPLFRELLSSVCGSWAMPQKPATITPTRRCRRTDALSVETYLKSQNGLFGDDERLALFLARGDEGYAAAPGDNSSDERAVEVHIFLSPTPPPPPPTHVDPPKPKPPLPGGPRSVNWQVAT